MNTITLNATELQSQLAVLDAQLAVKRAEADAAIAAEKAQAKADKEAARIKAKADAAEAAELRAIALQEILAILASVGMTAADFRKVVSDEEEAALSVAEPALM